MDNPSTKGEDGMTTFLPSLQKKLLLWIIFGNPKGVCISVLCLA